MKTITVESPKYGTQYILVDDDDYELVSQYTWTVVKKSSGKLYARTKIPHPSGEMIERKDKKGKYRRKRAALMMHTLIMKTPEGYYIDHINPKRTLDNRKSNLRVCTHQQNCFNRSLSTLNKSGFKGVCYDKNHKSKKWRAYITHNAKNMSLGSYKTKEEAARAYDEKAKELFGEFAHLNFPEEENIIDKVHKIYPGM